MAVVDHYEVLIFDADETLIDFHSASRKAFELYCLDHEIPNFERAYKIYGRHNKEAWHDLEAGKITTTEVRTRRFERFLSEIYRKGDPYEANACYLEHLVKCTKPFDEAHSILEKLSKTHRLAVITNGLQEVQRRDRKSVV